MVVVVVVVVVVVAVCVVNDFKQSIPFRRLTSELIGFQPSFSSFSEFRRFPEPNSELVFGRWLMACCFFFCFFFTP